MNLQTYCFPWKERKKYFASTILCSSCIAGLTFILILCLISDQTLEQIKRSKRLFSGVIHSQGPCISIQYLGCLSQGPRENVRHCWDKKEESFGGFLVGGERCVQVYSLQEVKSTEIFIVDGEEVSVEKSWMNPNFATVT